MRPHNAQPPCSHSPTVALEPLGGRQFLGFLGPLAVLVVRPIAAAVLARGVAVGVAAAGVCTGPGPGLAGKLHFRALVHHERTQRGQRAARQVSLAGCGCA